MFHPTSPTTCGQPTPLNQRSALDEAISAVSFRATQRPEIDVTG